jgi:fructose-1,6-bisphosphatase/inositol monophosphatase family enzyme
MLSTYKAGGSKLGLALAALLLLPTLALAATQDGKGAEFEIKNLINANNQHSRDNLKDSPGGVSKDGSLQFWSSGGLLQWVGNDVAPSEYDSFSLVAKHIQVVELPGGESAVAMYYAEGSFKIKGNPAVNHYMTRATEVYVREAGKWVVRASHWSPITAGSGTNQTSVD